MEHTLYTIGYAAKDIDSFIACLKEHGITCLVDVRSSPFSKTFPGFDKPHLKEFLKKKGFYMLILVKNLALEELKKKHILLFII